MNVTDLEMQDLLIAAEKRYRTTWSAKFRRAAMRLFRTLLIVTVKLVFLLRDTTVILTNFFYVLLMLPIDLLVTVLYSLAILTYQSDNQPVEKPLKLNVTRRLLWSGSSVCIDKSWDALRIPQNVVVFQSDNTKISASSSAAVTKRWKPLKLNNPYLAEPFHAPFDALAPQQAPLERPQDRAHSSDSPSKRQALAALLPLVQEHLGQNRPEPVSVTVDTPGKLTWLPDKLIEKGRDVPHGFHTALEGMNTVMNNSVSNALSTAVDAVGAVDTEPLKHGVKIDFSLPSLRPGSRHHYSRRLYEKSASAFRKTTN